MDVMVEPASFEGIKPKDWLVCVNIEDSTRVTYVSPLRWQAMVAQL